MELSESLFMEITGVRPSTPIYEAGPDKRKNTRVSFGARARIFPLMESAAGCGSPVMVRDLSRSGVGFQLYDEMSVGDEFVLHLTKQTGESVNLQCMVQRCEPGGTGLVQFVVGATFELVLTEAQWHEPKITQIAERGMLHPQLPTPAAVSAPEAESSKIRGRLSSMSSKLADRLAPSAPVAEPRVAETPLVLTSEPVFPLEMLAKARASLFGPSEAESPAAETVAVTVPASPVADATPAAVKPIEAPAAAVPATPVALPIAITTPAVETTVEAPVAIETQPEIAASPVEESVPAIEVTQVAVAEQHVMPAVEVSPATVVEPAVEATLEVNPQPAPAVVPIAEVPAATEPSPSAALEVIDELIATLTEPEPTPVAAPIEQVVTQPDVKLAPVAAAVAEKCAEESPASVVEMPEAIELVAEQEAVVDFVPSPKPEPTKIAPAVEAQTATPVVTKPPTQQTASRMMMAAPAAVPTIASTQDGSSSMVVIVVPSSMFTNGQKTISISAGGMDVTVSVASNASATAHRNPAIMNPAFDSTFDLLSEVIDPTAELLATA